MITVIALVTFEDTENADGSPNLTVRPIIGAEVVTHGDGWVQVGLPGIGGLLVSPGNLVMRAHKIRVPVVGPVGES